MSDLHSINEDQKLYVLKSGDGFSCLGFFVAEKRRAAYSRWTGDSFEAVFDLGTKEAYGAYLTAQRRVLEKVAATGQRCPVELEPSLIGLEGKRVEVTKGDYRERFYVGKSTGPIPIHLEIKSRASIGGSAVYIPEGATIRVVGQR